MAYLFFESEGKYVEMNYSQIFENILSNGLFNKIQEPEIKLFRKLYEMMDELKPTFNLLEELEYMAEVEKDEDLRSELKAEIEEIKKYLAPYENEFNEINKKLDALKQQSECFSAPH